MAKFDLVTRVHDRAIHAACDAINDQYFADDVAHAAQWADTAKTYGWFDKNDGIFTAALLDGVPVGFYEALPLTESATAHCLLHGIDEDQITPDHLVSHYDPCPAAGAYITGVAVTRDLSTYQMAQCNGALLAGLLQDLLHRYDESTLRAIMTSPATSLGLDLVQRFGFQPLDQAGLNQTYVLMLTPSLRQQLQRTQRLYHMRFVKSYQSQGK